MCLQEESQKEIQIIHSGCLWTKLIGDVYVFSDTSVVPSSSPLSVGDIFQDSQWVSLNPI